MKIKIKTILASALVLLLLFVSVLPAFAVQPVKLKLDIAGENGKVYVRFTAPANSDIATISLTLRYDTEKLTYSDTSYLSDEYIVSLTNDSETSSGVVTANLVIAESLMAETKLFTFVFDVADGADGEILFSVPEAAATNSENQAIDLTYDGALTSVLADLAPLTPDASAPDYATPPTSGEPGESSEPESSTDESNNGGSLISGIPGTDSKIVIGIAAGVVIVTLTAAVVIFIQKKRKSAE